MPDTETKAAPPGAILMVDDLPDNLELLSGILKGRGYKTRAAVSGEAALRAAEADPPDLILLDVNMPGMDGYEVCARLKAGTATRDIPVIFLSALNETADKVKGFGAGGVDFVCKPFQAEEVEARVSAHLELRRQRLLIQRNYERLKELERMRDGLVHMIVHDLRSPLSAIIAFLDFIRKETAGSLPETAVQDMDEVCRAAGVMMRMVNNVLDTSKMESGEFKLDLADCELRPLMERAAAAMHPLIKQRAFTVEGGEGAVVRADRELLSRVLQNLLGNALKFAPRDGYVRLSARPAGAGVRVSVENDGPHIPAEFHGRIFEKFGQVDSGGARQPYSTGLGLTFCKLAVEAHGGRIGVESSPGRPTVFWFELGT